MTKSLGGCIMKMFKVTAKCGHVGRNHYVVKNFPVQASNGREAAKIARDLPRVKHHHKDAIINVEEITLSEYYLLIQQNCNDPYFRCHNVQDQRCYEEVVFSEDIKSNRFLKTEKRLFTMAKKC